MRRLRNADELLAPAVAASIEALKLTPEFSGLSRLALRYAAQIDEAARIAADLAELVDEDAGAAKRVAALTKQVEAQAVLAELGPKLQGALESLGASPRVAKGVKDGKPARGALDAVRKALPAA